MGGEWSLVVLALTFATGAAMTLIAIRRGRMTPREQPHTLT
ncbi:hypothetical protein ABMA10_20135 [Plantibacter sp. RU18]